jgi:sigma-B regulation protein RsbU (phosphoserine phosphatase)
LYTDGLIEQTDPEGNLFGDEKVVDLFQQNAHCNARRMVDVMLSEIARFSDGIPFQDDISLMAVQYSHSSPEKR